MRVALSTFFLSSMFAFASYGILRFTTDDIKWLLKLYDYNDVCAFTIKNFNEIFDRKYSNMNITYATL